MYLRYNGIIIPSLLRNHGNNSFIKVDSQKCLINECSVLKNYNWNRKAKKTHEFLQYNQIVVSFHEQF